MTDDSAATQQGGRRPYVKPFVRNLVWKIPRIRPITPARGRPSYSQAGAGALSTFPLVLPKHFLVRAGVQPPRKDVTEA
jgi:hypothetical protein